MPLLRTGLCSSASADVIQALKAYGINSVSEFICCNIETIAHATKISYKDMVAIRRVLLAQYAVINRTGADLFKQTLDSVAILSTGSSVLDDMLDGGLYATEVTELVGSIAAGKSQICFCATASVAANTRQNVVFLDTCASFCAERIEEILAANIRQGADVEASLSRIRCVKVFDIYELIESLDNLRRDLVTRNDPFYSDVKLVIVDSLPAVVSPVLGGQQIDGLNLLSQIGLTLKSLALDFTLAILVTNNIVSGGGGSKVGLGRYWQHVPHTRVLVEGGSQRMASLIKSSRLGTANQRIPFTITDAGIVS